jgi:hypothetical protein
MSAPTYDTGSMGLMLNELRLPTIGRLWSEPPRECRRLRILAVMGDLKYGKRKQGKEAHRDAIFG